MSCEDYQSLPADERSPEDQLAIELAKVSCFPIPRRNEPERSHSSPNNGVDALDATRSSS